MRRLWITRHKAMAASAVKMKVYIEDPENGDTEINDCLCRKLGELKNDQQKHFNIGSDAAKVFVVAGKLSRNLYNEYVEIPEGEEDVFLSGRNYLNPGAGNPFRFDGVEEEDVLENRRKVNGRGRIILIVAIILGILAGGAIGVAASSALIGNMPPAAAAAVNVRCQELQITLTEEFTQSAAPGYTACYAAEDTAVFLLREDFEAMEGFGDLTLEEYGAMILANNHLDGVNLETEDGLTVFARVITDEHTGIPYYYYCGLYKGGDAFWMVQITTQAEGASEKIPQFRQWLGSVVLDA